MSTSQGTNNTNDQFYLHGTQINFEERSKYKERRWRSELSRPISWRPCSAVSDPSAYEVTSAPLPPLSKRPFSADTVLCGTDKTLEKQPNSFCETRPVKDCELASAQLLQSLLSESVETNSWPESSSVPHDSVGVLVPGVKSKPPLPSTCKTDRAKGDQDETPVFALTSSDVGEVVPRPRPDNCYVEDLEDSGNATRTFSGYFDEAKWLVHADKTGGALAEEDEENEENDNENHNNNDGREVGEWTSRVHSDPIADHTKHIEEKTDEQLRTVREHQHHLHESIYNVEHVLRAPKSKAGSEHRNNTTTTNSSLRDVYSLNKPKGSRANLPDDTGTKKPPKSILKGGAHKKSGRKEDASDRTSSSIKRPPSSSTAPPDVTSWMSANESHDNFLDFLNKLDELETGVQVEMSTQTVLPTNEDINDNDNLDEITSILAVLEKEDLKSQKNIESMKELVNNELRPPPPPPDTRSGSMCSLISSVTSNYNEFLSYLDDIDQSCMESLKSAKERLVTVTKVNNSAINVEQVPRLEDLLAYSQVELAHYVADLTLRLRERSAAVSTVQAELTRVRDALNTKSDEVERIVNNKLKAQKNEYEGIVRRHQKFIDQLIADKKALNKQCEGLINELKVLEDRYNTNMRSMEQRHKIDLQKARDMHAASEKLRRDKWIEGKTQKIKEMAMKSLEPELKNMETRHQHELNELRALHKRELEELEMRGARKTQQQCDALRQQLSEEREAAIAHERDLLRLRVDKLVEAEERGYQEQRRRLQAEHAAKVAECEERVASAQAERDRAVAAARTLAEEQMQAAQRRHAAELRNVRDALELEFEAWKNNFRKQQTIELAEAEAQMKEACKKDRDREIELVIERLERESSEARVQIEQAAENRLRRLNDKYDEETRDLERTLNEYKTKYTDAKEKLLANDEELISLRTNVKHLQTQLQQSRQILEEMSAEKSKIREQIKGDFQSEINALENEVRLLKCSKEEELQRIFAKVKLTVAHKDQLLSQLTNNNANLQQKCTLLENLLEEKQREYLIK